MVQLFGEAQGFPSKSPLNRKLIIDVEGVMFDSFVFFHSGLHIDLSTLKTFLYFIFIFILFFIVVQLQLSAFSPHPHTPPQKTFLFEAVESGVLLIQAQSVESELWV